MQNSPNDTINTMTVDIRLCGNIPRNEMKAHFGAPYPTTALTSQPDHLSTASLAEANGPTLHKLNNCSDDGLEGLTIQKTINMLNVLSSDKQLPLTPVLEPPSWAVPARVETRLEVRLMTVVWLYYSWIVPFLTPNPFSECSLYANRWVVKPPLILPPRAHFESAALPTVMYN